MSITNLQERCASESSSSTLPREANAPVGMDEDPESTTATVSQCIEQLHVKMSPPHEKELITACLPGIAEGDVKRLIKLAKTSSIAAAETAVAALVNLLSDPQIAAEALAEDVVSALTRVFGECTIEGKTNASRALHKLLKLFPVEDVLVGNAQCRFVILALADFLNTIDMEGPDADGALDVVSLLSGTKPSVNFIYPPWAALVEVPSSLEALVRCLADGLPQVQDKAIGILSRLCKDHPMMIGDLLIARPKSIGSLANKVASSSSLEVKVGGAALLTCGANEHKERAMEALDVSGYLKPLIYALVEMMKQNSGCCSVGYMETNPFQEPREFPATDPATILGEKVALWLLSIISSFHAKNKLTVIEAGGLEALADKLVSYISNREAEFDNTEDIWISALLLSILFQDENVVSSPATKRIIPTFTRLLRSAEVFDRYFAAQALASLICYGSIGINLAIATTSGAVAGLITLIGHEDSDLAALSEEFSLLESPDQVVLEHLFEIQDVRLGSAGRKSIPLLVDLLRPIPDRPGAPRIAVHLLTCIADGCDTNKVIMAEAGALDALTKYLSLSPQDSTEAAIAELLMILFKNPELLQYQASVTCMKQLIAVLQMGSRNARFIAAKALHELFEAENFRDSELARQAVQPFVDMLDAVSESEQDAALVALIKLTCGNPSKAHMLIDVKGKPLDSLYRILSGNSSLYLKHHVAQLCYVLFGDSYFRENPVSSDFMHPLISLMQSDATMIVESGVCALAQLLDDDEHVDLATAYEITDLLVSLVSGSNHRLVEASISCLIRLGKDRSPQKLDMVKAGVFDRCLELLPGLPCSICSSVAELFRILTNKSEIAKSPSATKTVEPLFLLLLRPDFSLWGQHSTLQALVNILEKPQSVVTMKLLSPSEVIERLITFLDSPSELVQQLGAELLSHLLARERFQQDIATKNAVFFLVRLAGIGIVNLQQIAITALEKISTSWPEAVAEAGGIFDLAKLIDQDDPRPPHSLWESAAVALCNILRSNAGYYVKVPVTVLVKMLHSTHESTMALALNALIIHEMNDVSSAEEITEAGGIKTLLELLRSHKCEEASGRLLEALFNNVRVRSKKISKYAIAPLAQYLLDPLTISQSGRLLAALSLGDLSQHEGLARASDSVSACRALISLLEDDPSDEIRMVSICALQNFVMGSRTNRRAVAEAGGILVIQEQLLCPDPGVAGQAAVLIKFLFSNHALQEYVSNALVKSLTAALEREMWCTATVNEEVLKAINTIFTNFPKIHMSEAATLCIPHLVGAIKACSEIAQDSVLDTLCLLKDSWPTIPIDTAKSQATYASEAIPILQLLMNDCQESIREKADSLLHCLPGCLTVTIKRGNNLKQAMGNTNAFCRLTLGNDPPRQTKVINHSITPEWKEGFIWDFDVPPKGQKLHILCKSKNIFRKATLGSVTIQIDKVLWEGRFSGLISLKHDSNKDGPSRTLEIEIIWCNRVSDESM